MSLRRIQERQLLQVRYKKFPVRLLESASIPVLTSADLDRSLRACGMEWLSGRVWPPHVLRGPPASLREARRESRLYFSSRANFQAFLPCTNIIVLAAVVEQHNINEAFTSAKWAESGPDREELRLPADPTKVHCCCCWPGVEHSSVCCPLPGAAPRGKKETTADATTATTNTSPPPSRRFALATRNAPLCLFLWPTAVPRRPRRLIAACLEQTLQHRRRPYFRLFYGDPVSKRH